MKRAVIITAICVMGWSCAPGAPKTAPAEPITRIILSASIPWWWEFCVENPDQNTRHNTVIRNRLVCRGTVDDLRHEFEQVLAAE